MGRHRATPPICTARKWSGHSQVWLRPPLLIRHRCEQPPLFTAQGLVTVREKGTGGSVTLVTRHKASIVPQERETLQGDGSGRKDQDMSGR